MSHSCPVCGETNSRGGKQFSARGLINHMKDTHSIIVTNRKYQKMVEEDFDPVEIESTFDVYLPPAQAVGKKSLHLFTFK